jgi:hypothetical protein
VVAGTQALQHVAVIDADGQLDHVSLLTQGNHVIGRDQHVLSERRAEHLAGDGNAPVWPEVMAELGRRQPGLDEREIAARQRHTRREVPGSRIDGDEVLGSLEDHRAPEHGAEDEQESEHGTQVDPARGFEPVGCRRGGGSHGGRV